MRQTVFQMLVPNCQSLLYILHPPPYWNFVATTFFKITKISGTTAFLGNHHAIWRQSMSKEQWQHPWNAMESPFPPIFARLKLLNVNSVTFIVSKICIMILETINVAEFMFKA